MYTNVLITYKKALIGIHVLTLLIHTHTHKQTHTHTYTYEGVTDPSACDQTLSPIR